MDTKADQNFEEPEEKLDFKRLLPIFVIVFVDLMGLTIIIPVLPYYAISYDAGPAVIGLMGAAYPAMQFFAGPVLGALSDRYGRKPILALAQIGTFCSLLLLGSANALWMVFLARILDGITGANLPTVQAAISDVTTAKTRSQGLGLVGAAFGLGFILGPAISGITLSLTNNNYSAPAFVASGFALLSVLLTSFMFKETLPPEKRGAPDQQSRKFTFGRLIEGVREPVTGILLVTLFVVQLVFGAFQLMFAPFTLTTLGLNSVGNTIVFLFFGVLAVIVQGFLIRKLTARFGERNLVIGGLLLMAIGLFVIAMTPRQTVPWYSQAAVTAEILQSSTSDDIEQLRLLPPETNSGYLGLIVLLVATIPVSFGSGVLSPSVNSLLTQNSAPEKVGAVLGLSASALSLGNIFGPLWGGATFDFIGANAPFWIGSLVLLLLFPIALRRVQAPPNSE